MRYASLGVMGLLALAGCSGSDSNDSPDAAVDAAAPDSSDGSGGQTVSSTGGSPSTGGTGASGDAAVEGGAGGTTVSTDSGTGCVATECLCIAFAACEPSDFTRSIGQNGLYVDRICGMANGDCSVVSYIQYLDTDSARRYRCSFPSDAPCDPEGSGLNASASPYCVSETCSPSGTACTDDFFACP